MWQRIWKFCCSLKLAIVLTSSATVLVVAGSLVMHFHPEVFGTLEARGAGRWWALKGAGHFGLSWWLPVTGVLLVALGLNTFCCFVEWARNLRQRWRKCGEYLIHLGFIMILAAYFWGTMSGFRSPGNRVLVGDRLELEKLPGYALQLEHFEPVFNEAGRPVDMRSTVALLRGEDVVRRTVVRTNHPLTYRGLAVVPGSFGRTVAGYRFFMAGKGDVALTPGTILRVGNGTVVRAVRFLPHAVRDAEGRVRRGGDRLGNPAVEVELVPVSGDPWRGWYFIRQGLPFPLIEAGVRLWPTEPIFRTYSVLTVNRDPGAGLALAGAMVMLAGVLLAMVSYYHKRSRGDRPDIA